MGHVIHDRGGNVLLVHELADGGHRFLVEHHALAENNEFRTVAVNELLGLFHVDLVDVVLTDGEIYHGGALRNRVNGDIVMQCAHGLRRQVAALDDMVVHDVAQALGGMLAVQAVLPVHQGGEHRHIGHPDHRRI